jgi:hypothetical protein
MSATSCAHTSPAGAPPAHEVRRGGGRRAAGARPAHACLAMGAARLPGQAAARPNRRAGRRRSRGRVRVISAVSPAAAPRPRAGPTPARPPARQTRSPPLPSQIRAARPVPADRAAAARCRPRGLAPGDFRVRQPAAGVGARASARRLWQLCSSRPGAARSTGPWAQWDSDPMIHVRPAPGRPAGGVPSPSPSRRRTHIPT